MPEFIIEKIRVWERISQPRKYDSDGNAMTYEKEHEALHIEHGPWQYYIIGNVTEDGGRIVESLVPWEFFWRYDTQPNVPGRNKT